jgi:phosphatidylinositol-3-phosphatase
VEGRPSRFLLNVLPLVLGGAIASSTTFAAPLATNPPHVMIVMLENTGYAATLGHCGADPYLCSLAAAYLSDTSWYGVGHPSLPNYLAITSGSTNSCTGDDCKGGYTSDIGQQLDTAGISWTAYMESMPTACYPHLTSGDYEKWRNPFPWYADDACSIHDIPYPGSSGLLQALDGPSPPDFVWISPNHLHDMEGGSVLASDRWLKANLTGVLTSAWFTGGNATVIVTMDEHTGSNAGCCGDAAGGQIPMVVISSKAASIGKVATTGDLYGTLRSLERAYGLPLLGAATTAANGDLTAYFG